jgi:peptide/nickel transport system permease protein
MPIRHPRPLPALSPGMKPLEARDRDALVPGRAARKRFEEATEAIRDTPSLLVGLALSAFLTGIAVAAVLDFGPGLTQLQQSFGLEIAATPSPPSATHPFGTLNVLGIDLFVALFQATPIDVALVTGILVAAAAIGWSLGSGAGLFGGASEWLVAGAGDVLASVPVVFLVWILFVGIQPLVRGPGVLVVFGALFVAVLWPYYARPVRIVAGSVGASGYFEAARASGASRRRLLVRHGLPNTYVPILAQLPVDVANIFFFLVVFPYVTCITGGTYSLISPLPSAAFPEWGTLLGKGICYASAPLIGVLWWVFLFPTAAIVLYGIAVATTCDGLERWSARRVHR